MLQKIFNILATSLSVLHNHWWPKQNYFQICISTNHFLCIIVIVIYE